MPGAPPAQRVLLVDDDPVIRMLTSSLLRRGGYEVETADDGAQALERITGGEQFDLVVTDLHMPNLDGAALLAALRASPAHARMPVVLLTGSEDAVRRAALLEAGAAACIGKPIEMRTFVERIRAVSG